MHCGKDAVQGYGHCFVHGGPNPSKNFYGLGTMTTGAGSSFPLTRLAAKYNQMRNNGRILSNRAAVEIIDDRILQLAERIDVEDAPDRLNSLYTLWQEYTSARDDGRTTEASIKRKALDNLFDKARTDYEAWNQMMLALDLRRKMVESEVKVIKEIKAIMTAEDGYELVAKLQAAVLRVVEDPKKLMQVQYEFSRIIGESGDRASETSGRDAWGGGGEEVIESGPGEVYR
jgi:hypothetical protein